MGCRIGLAGCYNVCEALGVVVKQVVEVNVESRGVVTVFDDNDVAGLPEPRDDGTVEANVTAIVTVVARFLFRLLRLRVVGCVTFLRRSRVVDNPIDMLRDEFLDRHRVAAVDREIDGGPLADVSARAGCLGFAVDCRILSLETEVEGVNLEPLAKPQR